MNTKVNTDMLVWKIHTLREAEKAAAAERANLESILCEAMDLKDEGSSKLETENYKIEVTTKLTRSVDGSDEYALQSVIHDLPPSYKDVVNFKPSLNLKRYRELQKHESDAFGMLSRFITSKPSRPSVKVTIKESE